MWRPHFDFFGDVILGVCFFLDFWGVLASFGCSGCLCLREIRKFEISHVVSTLSPQLDATASSFRMGSFKSCIYVGGGFIFFCFVTPIWGKIPILTFWQILFRWVETTNWIQYLVSFFFFVYLATRVSYIWYSSLLSGYLRKSVDDQDHRIPSQIIPIITIKEERPCWCQVSCGDCPPPVIPSGLWHVQLSEGSPVRFGPFVATRTRVMEGWWYGKRSLQDLTLTRF